MSTHRIHSFRAVAAVALACAGTLMTAPAAIGAEVTATPQLTAAALPRAAVLTEVRTAFADGDRIGSLHAGNECRTSGEREWSPLIRRSIETEVSQVFREELAKAQLPGTKTAPLKVQAFLNDIHIDVCQAAAGAWQGGFYVQVGWQIVSPQSGKVVYQASTDGAFTLATPQRATSSQALHEAFGVAVRNLLSDRRFVAVLQESRADQFALAQ